VAADGVNPERSFFFTGPPERLDRFLARSLTGWSRTRLQALIKKGAVTVDGRAEPGRRLLTPGERVVLVLPEFSELPAAAARAVPLLHEDRHLLVVDKPAGWVVHPAGPHRTETLVQRLWPKLAAGWGADAAQNRPGVVHRLDKGTTGVIVIAKTPAAAENLARQFAERRVEKIYWAVVRGLPTEKEGRIRSMVGRSRQEPHRMTTSVPGRWAETEFRVLKTFPKKNQTLLEVRPKTGRTHQIRVQMAALGFPLVGDSLYGGPAGDRPLLHAHQLAFTHPATGKKMIFKAPAPPDMRPFLV
jgi:23S rRNA pseudouridine1911/1915/1917 synthase